MNLVKLQQGFTQRFAPKASIPLPAYRHFTNISTICNELDMNFQRIGISKVAEHYLQLYKMVKSKIEWLLTKFPAVKLRISDDCFNRLNNMMKDTARRTAIWADKTNNTIGLHKEVLVRLKTAKEAERPSTSKEDTIAITSSQAAAINQETVAPINRQPKQQLYAKELRNKTIRFNVPDKKQPRATANYFNHRENYGERMNNVNYGPNYYRNQEPDFHITYPRYNRQPYRYYYKGGYTSDGNIFNYFPNNSNRHFRTYYEDVGPPKFYRN